MASTQTHRNIGAPAREGLQVPPANFLALLLLRFGEEVPEAVEATLPERAATGDPALRDSEACRFHVTGADAAYFPGANEAAVYAKFEQIGRIISQNRAHTTHA